MYPILYAKIRGYKVKKFQENYRCCQNVVTEAVTSILSEVLFHNTLIFFPPIPVIIITTQEEEITWKHEGIKMDRNHSIHICIIVSTISLVYPKMPRNKEKRSDEKVGNAGNVKI